MGKDVKAARNWGVRDVEIVWTPQATDSPEATDLSLEGN